MDKKEQLTDIRLTQFSHGAGCGCKISPAVLNTILQSGDARLVFPNLIVGNESRDDAAVYDMGDGTYLLSTTDFFTPIVDDATTFGAIASTNAISDVYAMGGEPLMAIAILGWPVDKLPAMLAAAVIEGSRRVCREANIPLAGGHSIDTPEPIFGLAVTGRVARENLKRNDTARPGSLLYLTKPLGTGIVTTAQKQGIVSPEHLHLAVDTMSQLNTAGSVFGKLPYVNAMTDVTGFGLLGHLVELCEGSGLSAEINFEQVPRFPFLESYVAQQAVPGGTGRNWKSYGAHVSTISEQQRIILADPQTSGGLLVAVDPGSGKAFEKAAKQTGMHLESFGTLKEQDTTPMITVR